jgi:hypothetical protein
MYLLKRYQIGVAVMLICILSCSTTLFAQSKQAIQQYEAGLMALEKNEPKKAIQYFTTATIHNLLNNTTKLNTTQQTTFEHSQNVDET